MREERMDLPGGAKMALSVVVNVEEGSEQTIARGDKGMEPVDELGIFIKAPIRNYSNESNYLYGIKAGAPRVAAVQAQPVEQKAAQVRTDLPGWEQVLADRIAADLADDGQEIELSLSPEKLGPLKIKLELADGQAQVKIITATPEAAKLFTETQHRLSEHLARAGLDLGGQSAESRQPRDDRPAPRGMRATEFMARAQRGEVEAAAPTRRAGAGLVNLMA